MPEMICRYQEGTPNRCGAPISMDIREPSGYVHLEGHGYLHWASPTPYQLGGPETERIMKPCMTCGEIHSGNPAHILHEEDGGHKFFARME